MYDSKQDTLNHRLAVSKVIETICNNLLDRRHVHDSSKLEDPEKSIFDKYTPMLKETSYGTPEYKKHLKEMGAGLKHHYENNRHHPEHFRRGISDMNLIDIVEMFADWCAAVKRHVDGNIFNSLLINKERFGMSEELFCILWNTAEAMERE